LKCSTAEEWAVTHGVQVVRAVCVLGSFLGVTAVTGRAMGGGDEQLYQPRPDRLVIESSQRVSDGRKLQRDADNSFRRAEGGGVVGAEQAKGAGDAVGDGSQRASGSGSGESAASETATNADR
jgi:hypothetical protein